MAQFHDPPSEQTDFTLILPKQYFFAVAFGKATLEEGLAKGIVKLEGDSELVRKFFASFDSPVYPIRLSLR